jgi:hypothetical protein
MKKNIKILIGGIILSWLFGTMSARQYFTRNRPESSQPELRRTVPVQLNYGKTVYVTPGENRLLYFTSEWVGIPLVIAVIFVASLNNKPNRKNDA